MKIVIFLSIFSLCTAAPSDSVSVTKVKVHCKLEITSKVECFLPSNTQLTDVVEILSSFAFTTGELSDDEVREVILKNFQALFLTL